MHLLGLKSGIATQDRKLNKARRQTDTATVAVSSASAAVSAARESRNMARLNERNSRIARDNFVTAARAEADSLRRDHTVGA